MHCAKKDWDVSRGDNWAAAGPETPLVTYDSPVKQVAVATLEQPTARSRRWQFTLLLFTTFIYTTGSDFANILVGGRLAPQPGVTGGVVSTHAGHLATDVGRILIVLVPLFIGALNARKHHANGSGLIAVLVMVAGTQLVNIADLGSLGLAHRWYIIPLIAFALWSIGLDWDDLKVIGYFCAGLSLLSLMMLASTDRAWMINGPSVASNLNESKALIGHKLLAGPFAQMNNLGMSVAVGVPFCFMIGRRWRRWTSIGLILVTCVLAASRTSLIAVVAVVGSLLVFALFRSQEWRRMISWLMMIGAAAVVVWVPLHTTNPAAYTNRGEIWLLSRQFWGNSWATGLSTSTYTGNGKVAESLGHSSYHGHNLFVTVMTCGGVLLLFFMVPLAIGLVGRALAVLPFSFAPVLFVIVILSMSIAEMPLRIDTFDGASWITWTALLALMLFNLDSVTTQKLTSGSEEEVTKGTGIGVGAATPVVRVGKGGSVRTAKAPG